ncbi:MAG: nucleotide exchange factor GrpE [Gammaproteobacteria bacterium]|nr:nucleotide exchange factor GrpE [Gammaproteobacteria bacterium]MCP5409589.1 nucleotide exchange factor GrpE [Chromatiaceae bacterium]MCP5441533.1 nucleotide exchange factor GrpE [Chromatiaceae bacterium]
MEKEQVTVENETVTDENGAAPEESVEAETQSPEAESANQEKLVLMLEDARTRADENWDQLVRTRAEMDNLRKRQARELENAHKFALERFVNALLPVRDSMEMGLIAASEESADVAKLREGVELTLKLMTDVMGKFDVVQIDPQGEPFDPELHQAMSMVPREDVPPNTVVIVVQKGYTLNGRLVRPAMVMVSQTTDQ